MRFGKTTQFYVYLDGVVLIVVEASLIDVYNIVVQHCLTDHKLGTDPIVMSQLRYRRITIPAKGSFN